ncbi:MAG: leucine-rich repeat protein [Clostridia bacterium]|nr:leucine-rich repeat protein [Clostridia bacterium]
MKKLAVLLLIILSALCLFVFAACEAEQPAESGARTESPAEKPSDEQSSAGDNPQSTIINNDAAVLLSANGFTDDGDGNYRITLPNETEVYSFINQITVSENATWVISLDVYGMNTVLSKTIPVEIGDNVVYLIVISGDGETVAFYTMTVRRRPLYTVTFNTNGGTAVNSQTVEEGYYATEPQAAQKAGYTFVNWNFDFTSPIVENKIISAVWQANTDTPYKVEYYLENLEDNDYTLTETANLTGTTDTTAYAEIKAFEHFTATKNTVSGNIAGNGNSVLKVYYTRNKYSISISASDNVILDKTYSGTYKYGYSFESVTATFNEYIGYEWVGWCKDGELFTAEKQIAAFTAERDVSYVATAKLKAEYEPFDFTSTATSCTITGIKDKTVTEIVVPSDVTEISEGVFNGCFSLKSITIPFVGAKAGTNETDTYQYPFGYIFGTSSYVGSTATRQYYYGSSLSSTTNSTYYIPSSLQSITVTGGNILYGAFRSCSSLTSITIGNGVTSIGGSAFSGCSSLTSITIPDSVTSIGSGAFGGCSSLESITIPFVGAKANVTETDTYQYPFGYIFGTSDYAYSTEITQYCYGSSLSSTTDSTYYIPSSLQSVTVTGGNILYGAFYNCSSLTSVTIGNGVTSIGEWAFYNCSSLTSVTIGNGVTSIGYAAFAYCYSLTSVTIPDSVTSIGNSAFYNCGNLTSVTIGNGVMSIGNSAFSGCNSLTSIKFNGTKAQWQAISKDSSWKNNVPSKCVVHCDDGDLSI